MADVEAFALPSPEALLPLLKTLRASVSQTNAALTPLLTSYVDISCLASIPKITQAHASFSGLLLAAFERILPRSTSPPVSPCFPFDPTSSSPTHTSTLSSSQTGSFRQLSPPPSPPLLPQPRPCSTTFQPCDLPGRRPCSDRTRRSSRR